MNKQKNIQREPMPDDYALELDAATDHAITLPERNPETGLRDCESFAVGFDVTIASMMTQ